MICMLLTSTPVLRTPASYCRGEGVSQILKPELSITSGGQKTPWWRHQMETFSALQVICAVNSPVTGELPHKGQWRGALIFSLICVWINDWVNNREAGDLRRYRAHCDVTVMTKSRWAYLIYSLHVIFADRNINMYLHFLPFFQTDMSQVVEILLRERQGHT